MAQSRVTLLIDLKSRLAGLNRTISGVKQLGSSLTAALAPLAGFAAVGLAIRGTVGQIHDFETSMLRVKALTGATGEAFSRLQAQAAYLGETTQFSASESADAMGFLAMAGMNTEQIIGAMPNTLNLAAAAHIGLGEAADITTNILAGYGMEVSDLARVNDVMVNAITSTNTNMTELGEAMKAVGPVASAMHISIEETTAALGMLANAGIKGEMGGTALRNTISKLLNPSGEAAAAIERLGLNIQNTDGTTKGFTEILSELARTGASATDIMQIFGLRAGPSMLALLKSGSGAMAEQTELLKRQGTTAEIAELQMSGLDGAWKRLKSAIASASILFGEGGFKGILTGVVNVLTDIVKVISLIIATGGDMKIISLALEAAFDEGFAYVKGLVAQYWGSGTGTSILGLMLAATIHAGLRITEAIYDAFTSPLAGIRAMFEWVWQGITNMFNAVITEMLAGVELALNKMVDGVNWLLPKSKEFGHIALDFDAEKGTKTLGEFYDEQKKVFNDFGDLMGNHFDSVIADSWEIFAGVGDEVDSQLSAWEQIKQLISDSNAETAAFIAGTGESGGVVKAKGGAGDPKGDTSLSTEMTSVSDVLEDVDKRITGDISTGLTGLITQTQTWGGFLLNIGQNFADSMIGGFVQMGVEWTKQVVMMGAKWVATKLSMFAFEKSLQAKESSETKRQTSEKAVEAGMKSVAQLGPIWGPIAFAGSLIAIAALASSFADGGFTGIGGKYAPAGIVHKGEFVLPQDVTSRIGVGNLYRMMAETRMGYASGGVVDHNPAPAMAASPSGGGRTPVSILWHDGPDSRADAYERMQGEIVEIKSQLGLV